MSATRKARPANPASDREEIAKSLTVSEVANGWNKHFKTVKLAIDTNRLTARKTGAIWLISYSSVVRLWGLPEVELSEVMHAQGE